MSCVLEPIYANPSLKGCIAAHSGADGYTIEIRWTKAVPNTEGYQIAYNIYFSTIREDVFTEGVKYVVLDSEQTTFFLLGDFIPEIGRASCRERV